MNRGARKVSIFSDEVDRRIFVSLMGRFATKYEVDVLAWCLMPNHYHVESDTDGPKLCAMMRDLDGNYARSFNLRHDTTGCLFQGPFKSVQIDDSVGLAHVSRYIHLNPIDLGESPIGYRWSSCNDYLGMTSPPPWLNTGPVKSALRNEDLSDSENYRRYLQEGMDRPRKPRKADPLADFHAEWIRHLEERCIERLTGRDDLLGQYSIQTLVCYVAHRLYRVPAEMVAEYFGYSGADAIRSLCWRFQERAADNPSLQEAILTVYESASQKRKQRSQG
jgi:REP element-mobilizing transposase RayT